MSELFTWSIDLGRWAGVRVRLSIWLTVFVVGTLLIGATSRPSTFVPTLAWVSLFLLALALHELGHVVGAVWRRAEPDDLLLWPLGNLVSPGGSRSHEDVPTLLAGPAANGLVAVGSAIGLALAGWRMVLNPFGLWPDSGAPIRLADPSIAAAPLSAAWWFGWFGWLNWVLFLANVLLPALPLDLGRVVRSTVARPGLGLTRDVLIGPHLARATAILLGVVGLLRLAFSRRSDSLVLIGLAIFLELFVRAERHLMEDGHYDDDGVFGYDFSEGYTSLESGTAKVRPARESALNRWRRRRSDVRRNRRQAQVAAEDRRLDEILDKLHRLGRASLSEEENRFLVRVSAKIKRRPRDGPAT